MNTRHLFLFAPFALAATLLAQPAAPDSPAGPARGRGAPRAPMVRMDPLMRVLDTDKDGHLSPAEIAASATVLPALDVNDDGNISPDEIRFAAFAEAVKSAPAHDTPRARGGRFLSNGPLGFELDANRDGIIQPMEICNAFSSLQLLDANHDGTLSPDEVRPLYQHRRPAPDTVALRN
jgi:hypothetical protein